MRHLKHAYIRAILATCIVSIAAVSANTYQYNVQTNSICQAPGQPNNHKSNICTRFPELVQHLENGIRMALYQCQRNFASRRWNCTTSHRTFKRILKSDTREAAYVHAVVSAGILHSITSACSHGTLWQCHCDTALYGDKAADGGDWQWGGCSDNVQYGYNKSRYFTDRKQRRSDIKALIRLHNNEAGRLSVTKHMRKVCKCHGLSGSCALKTCWRAMDAFQSTAKRLQDKYDGAPKVLGSNDGGSLIPESAYIKPPNKLDLVYINNSPDFCSPNKKFGTSGTIGRRCNATSDAPDGCGIMCCNRGFDSATYTVKEKCNCKFFWCCEVKCEMCVNQVTVTTCL